MQASTCTRKTLYTDESKLLNRVSISNSKINLICGGEKTPKHIKAWCGHAFIFLPFFCFELSHVIDISSTVCGPSVN